MWCYYKWWNTAVKASDIFDSVMIGDDLKSLYKIPEFHLITYVKILWKSRDSTNFQVSRLKLSGNCAFSQNFRTRKLSEITVFYAVKYNGVWYIVTILQSEFCC